MAPQARLTTLQWKTTESLTLAREVVAMRILTMEERDCEKWRDGGRSDTSRCLFTYSSQTNPSTLLISWVWNFLVSRKKYQGKFYMYSCHVYLQGRGGNGYGEQEVGKTPSQWGYPEVILKVHGTGEKLLTRDPTEVYDPCFYIMESCWKL